MKKGLNLIIFSCFLTALVNAVPNFEIYNKSDDTIYVTVNNAIGKSVTTVGRNAKLARKVEVNLREVAVEVESGNGKDEGGKLRAEIDTSKPTVITFWNKSGDTPLSFEGKLSGNCIQGIFRIKSEKDKLFYLTFRGSSALNKLTPQTGQLMGKNIPFFGEKSDSGFDYPKAKKLIQSDIEEDSKYRYQSPKSDKCPYGKYNKAAFGFN